MKFPDIMKILIAIFIGFSVISLMFSCEEALSETFADNYKPYKPYKPEKVLPFKVQSYEHAFDLGYRRAYQVVKRDIPTRRYIIEKRLRSVGDVRTDGERGYTDGLIFGFRSIED